jgi:trehalose-6-phosphatase
MVKLRLAAAAVSFCQVDWDKGRALLHLLEVLGLQQQADVLPIYIGDDKTDEDAFKALQGTGAWLEHDSSCRVSVSLLLTCP